MPFSLYTVKILVMYTPQLHWEYSEFIYLLLPVSCIPEDVFFIHFIIFFFQNKELWLLLVREVWWWWFPSAFLCLEESLFLVHDWRIDFLDTALSVVGCFFFCCCFFVLLHHSECYLTVSCPSSEKSASRHIRAFLYVISFFSPAHFRIVCFLLTLESLIIMLLK